MRENKKNVLLLSMPFAGADIPSIQLGLLEAYLTERDINIKTKHLYLKAADFYGKLVDSVIDRLSSLIEPLLIILLAGVVGSIIIITYLPVFNLGMAISSGVK